jgi:hypothetical protein
MTKSAQMGASEAVSLVPLAIERWRAPALGERRTCAACGPLRPLVRQKKSEPERATFAISDGCRRGRGSGLPSEGNPPGGHVSDFIVGCGCWSRGLLRPG